MTGSTTAAPATTPLEWVLVFLLVARTFFWGATAYSLAVGKGRAIKFERSLPSAAVLTLYTEKALDLTVGGVRKAACTDPGSAYRYRCDGLVLVMSTSENYVMLPRTWTYKQATAIVLPWNGPGAHRLEFARSIPTTPPPVC
ncbi:hypothetical protein [Nocardia sp. NPDC051463]|uniref:hypothetical protein n=1 Tax=Nocardia sp. NPDC051463 TaxID=3154845 RepID=UPI003433CB54